MPRVTRVAAVAVPLAVLLAGCNGAGSSVSFGSLQHSEAQSSIGGGGAPSANNVAPAPMATDTQVNRGPSLGTPQGRLERSVDVDFVVPHNGFLDAFDALIERAANLGGYVLSSTTTSGGGGRIDRGTLVVRVPSAKLNDMVTGTPSSWQVSSVNYGSVDHTSETVDLTARVKAITAHRDALQKLLDSTTSLTDITTLENQLADVQQQLDQVQGQLDSVNGRVDMATATIGLAEKGVVIRPAPKPSPTPRLWQALLDGWSNAVAVVSAVTLGLFSVLPLLVLAALGLLAWRRARRPVRA